MVTRFSLFWFEAKKSGALQNESWEEPGCRNVGTR
jgi:hypothetical protein